MTQQQREFEIVSLWDLIRDVPDFPKPGIIFKDITPLLADPAGLSLAVEYLTQPFRAASIDVVVGAESRGFIFGTAVAVDGPLLAVGAPTTGIVWIYRQTGGVWNLEQKVRGSGGCGAAVALDGHTLAVGCPDAAQADPEDYTGRTRRVYQELRDRKVALFIDKLPQGVWELRYEMRAEVPGEFHALPALPPATDSVAPK